MLAQAEESAPLLVGQSPRIRNVLRMVEKLGRCRWPVLLLGETGTGKEVVARSIHKVQPVGPFVTIDCSSLVGPLMESELFGHVKGAFTGAVTSKTGLIEVANGGTAFFDEIGELPLDLQAKLLRVLQEKEFRPVGSLTHRRSDFRVIAATNRDLAKEVEKGTFRRDLFYRLNVVNLRLAPLRDRKEDIPALIAHFLARHGKRTHADPGNARGHAFLRLARQRSRARKLHSAHGRHQHRAVAACRRAAFHAAEPPAREEGSVAFGGRRVPAPDQAARRSRRLTSIAARPKAHGRPSFL